MRHAILVLGFCVSLAAACGGSQKTDDTTTPSSGRSEQVVSGSGGEVQSDSSGSMISPDKMDESERDLNRKSSIMSQCLASAVATGDEKRGAHGKVTLEIIVTSGKASSVNVIKSDFQSEAVKNCVIKHVQEIQFPVMVKPYETSHAYSMEAN